MTARCPRCDGYLFQQGCAYPERAVERVCLSCGPVSRQIQPADEVALRREAGAGRRRPRVQRETKSDRRVHAEIMGQLCQLELIPDSELSGTMTA